jgi:hypothetical protein
MPVLKALITAVVAAVILAPAPAAAQQTFNFYLGGFTPRPEDARANNDVLVQDRRFLDFDFGELNGATVGAEWLVALGDKFDAGVGLGFYQRTALAADRFSEFAGTGDPILADLKLRVAPISATVRFLPLGHRDAIEPYIGAGAGVFLWRYSETGDFVAADDVTIVRGNFVGSGAAAGPVILGGVRIPVGSWGIGGEIRYQSAEGNLPADQGFAGSKIDLGGFTYSFTFGVRF